MNLPKLLRELHAERQWLETMIGALEVASRSPAHRFTGILVSSIQNGEAGQCILHLRRRKKAELARLAGLLHRDVRRRRRAEAKIVPFALERRRKEAVG
jgi:hypothetical protein